MLSLTSPVKTPFHRVPAGVKLAALSVATVGLFVMQSPAALGLALVGTGGLYAICGTQVVGAGMRALKPLGLFVAVVMIWHGWTGTPAQGVAVSLRMVTAVALANLVTMTTRLEDMTDVAAWLLRPLHLIGLSPRVLSFAIALVIRFTPVLLSHGQRLHEAWRARSPRRPKWHIVLPLTLLALDDAEHVSEALRARGGLDR